MTREEIQAQIEVLKTELSKLEELAKEPSKFKFKFPSNRTYLVESYSIGEGYAGNDRVYLNHGRYRITKKGAELSLERNRKANRLEMLADYLGALQEFKFGVENWYVFYDCHHKRWRRDISRVYYVPERVYMTLEGAKEVARLLNSGEYEL
jgi:hypothetical protein